MRCIGCGTEVDSLFLDECYSCREKSYRNKMKEEILSNEIDSTFREDEVYCPYCGEVCNIDDNFDLYEEGEHELYCDHCNKEFLVTVDISYSYSSDKLE